MPAVTPGGRPPTVARVLVTGSTTGLGLGAARALVDAGHDVVLHARNAVRAMEAGTSVERAAGIVVGDLADLDEVRGLAAAANAFGPIDAVIHNAAVYPGGEREATRDGWPAALAVNVLAPYLLTMLVAGPARLVYLSSDMHASGRAALDDLAWTRRRWNGTQAYCDSKLLVTALAMAVARHWPAVCSNAVDPGWVPTRMGGPGATDDLDRGADTQAWLAAGVDPAATATTGGYWYHRRRRAPAPIVGDLSFQDDLLAVLGQLSGTPFAARSG